MRNTEYRYRFDEAEARDQPQSKETIEAVELAHAYHRVFGSEDGQLVLADLERESMLPMVNTSDPNSLAAVGVQYKQKFVQYMHMKIQQSKRSSTSKRK